MKAWGDRQWRRWTAIFVILKSNANFRTFWIAVGISNFGTWMQVVAQDWFVLVVLDAGPGALGLVTALQVVPGILVASLGGTLADRFPKQNVLVATNALAGVLSVAMGVMIVVGSAQIWHVYALAFLLGTARGVDSPARLTFGAELVTDEDVPKAIGMSSISFNFVRFAGPGIGGLLIALAGTGPVFLVNAATFVVPCAALLVIGRRTVRPERSNSGGIFAALLYAWERPGLRAAIFAMFFAGFVMNVPMFIALMASEVYRVGAAPYGVLGSIMAVGSLAGTLYAGTIAPKVRGVLAALAGLGLLLALLSVMPNYLAFALVLPIVGGLSAAMNVSAHSFVQLASVNNHRGRVTALVTTAASLGQPIGALLMGWVAEMLGARFGGIACGIVAVIGAAGVVYWLSRGRANPTS